MSKYYQKRNRSKQHQRERLLGKTYYLFCEGENTEPEYFKSFPLQNVQVKTFGLAQQRKKLVETAIEYIKENQLNLNRNDEVWAVFDFDKEPREIPKIKEQYQAAIDLANRKGIKYAISNDSFELWLYLHFNYTDAENLRTWYDTQVKEQLNLHDLKTKRNAARLYDLLIDRQSTAIRNAKKLEKVHKNNRYSDKNPYTSVYHLVEELNKNLDL